MTHQQLSLLLQILSIEGIGPKYAGKLIQNAGSIESTSNLSPSLLTSWGIPQSTHRAILNPSSTKEIEDEIVFVDKHNIKTLGFWEAEYPPLLRACPDAPVMLFGLGDFCVDLSRLMISVVGTRSMTPYGRKMTEQIIETLAPYQPVIVSGLAAGVDGTAHHCALEHGLDTIAVLGQGLGTAIFPQQNRSLAQRIVRTQGSGLISELTHSKPALPAHFPFRNRIVAGMCHATILIEAKAKAGALITAELAYGYDRDVFAVPGRVGDICSAGCNSMISHQRAIMLDSPEVLVRELKLDSASKPKVPIQIDLFEYLSEQEKPVMDVLRSCERIQADELCVKLSIPSHKLMGILLELELKGLVDAMPGKYYAVAGRV